MSAERKLLQQQQEAVNSSLQKLNKEFEMISQEQEIWEETQQVRADELHSDNQLPLQRVIKKTSALDQLYDVARKIERELNEAKEVNRLLEKSANLHKEALELKYRTRINDLLQKIQSQNNRAAKANKALQDKVKFEHHLETENNELKKKISELEKIINTCVQEKETLELRHEIKLHELNQALEAKTAEIENLTFYQKKVESQKLSQINIQKHQLKQNVETQPNNSTRKPILQNQLEIENRILNKINKNFDVLQKKKYANSSVKDK